MIIGIPNKSKTLFDPINAVRYPSDIDPKRAPMELIDPIQEISSLFNGPLNSDVLFEAKIGTAGDTQPINRNQIVIE